MRKFFRRTTPWLYALLAWTAPQAGARAVWIDTDLSLGSPLREVDDAYALFLAIRSPELQIAGISTTYGNAPVRSTTERTRDSLGAFGKKIAVHPGASPPGDPVRATAASEALAAALQREKLTYIALGPLTNLANFLTLHPGQAGRIEEVIMVAGKTPKATLGFGPREKFRIHDANFVKDHAAMRAILAAPIPILLTPIETSGRLLLDTQDLRAIEASGPAGRFLARKSALWLWFWTHFVKADGGPIFDALPIVAAARPSLLKIEKRSAVINAKGEFIIRPQRDETGRKVSFCSAFSPATKDFVLRRLREKR